ncbi:hypothetical protein [Epilithonimonas mollis]|uniref:Uncharacterized protein n=1 Tax=Epilithonimonas mollis TaxID=216903 RepID=A0A1M6NMM3_9FLAO|nr:hypothetical protein [Epilithonimonas mollis]SHJ96989.1 hypothetical protein SAMN05444371_0521 [Epilithonimonas mollis]
MKLLYRLLVFCLLLSGYIVVAQDISVAEEIKKIDSLIENYQFELAQKKTDSLYKTKTGKSQFLEVRFRQALLLDKQEESSVESLKVLLSIIDDSENAGLHSLSCRIYLLTALAYEKSQNFELTNL